MNKTDTTHSVLYRVDGSHTMGLGHVFRARSVCKALQCKGIDPVILSLSDASLIAEMSSWGIPVYRIFEQELFDYLLYHASKHNTDILIQDIRDTDAHFIRRLKEEAHFKLVHFDDLGSGRAFADVLIDANRSNIEGIDDTSCRHLFGKQYMALDPCYRDYNRRRRHISSEINNIVISLGGSDPRHLTGWVVELLGSHLRQFNVTVVTGKSAEYTNETQQLCKRFGYKHLHNTDNMPELLFEADLAIIAGGITLYEAAAVGTPSIVLPQVEHQYTIAKEFEAQSASYCAFSHTQKDAAAFLRVFGALIKDRQCRQQMSRRGKELVSGDGVFLIADVISQICEKKRGESGYVSIRQ